MPENHTQTMQRERWGTKLGVIFAVAGSAVGLGNFLRFPGVVVKNGGGVFMIPYFLAFLLVGIPICWAEWTLGRRGGRISGLSSSPGVFGVLGRGGILKYFGVLGVFIPVVVFMYYVYVESWCLSYACFSATGSLVSGERDVDYGAFFSQYTSTASPPAVTAADITDADLLIATLRQPRTQAQQRLQALVHHQRYQLPDCGTAGAGLGNCATGCPAHHSHRESASSPPQLRLPAVL